MINTHRAEAQHRTLKEFLWIWTVRFVINFAILGLLAMAGAAIYYAAEVSLEASVEQVRLKLHVIMNLLIIFFDRYYESL